MTYPQAIKLGVIKMDASNWPHTGNYWLTPTACVAPSRQTEKTAMIARDFIVLCEWVRIYPKMYELCGSLQGK